MQTFLNKVAQHVVANYADQLTDLCIVFPNRRAGLFFKAELSKELKKIFIAPAIFSVEDLVQELSQTEKLDPISQLFTFYEAYRDVNKDKSEPFEEFSKWAPGLLTDYNEIDSYLVDPKSIFSNLNDLKELESWSLGSTQLTDFQKKYLEFWKSLGLYYEKYIERLNSKHQSYQGLSYRKVAENISEIAKNIKWHKIIFAGFNALTLAEEKIIQTLVEKNIAEVLWDCDTYYVGDTIQEAGKFIRRHKERKVFGKKFNWEENLFLSDVKNITIIGAPKNIAQAKLAGDLVNTISKSQPNLTNTAVVLADEKLLIPMLNSFPETIDKVNVTMGYPLKNSPLLTLIELIFNLQENIRLDEHKKPEYYHRNVIDLIMHPFISGVFKENTITSYIQKENIVFVGYDDLLQHAEEKFTTVLFKPWITVDDALNSFTEIIFELRGSYNEQETKKTSIEVEFLFSFYTLLKQLKTLLGNFDFVHEIKTFRTILIQLIKNTNLSFYGEPLSGLQVMGMLETRTLDFENVILLSVNEGILPAAKQSNSFIPLDVKRAFGLPTYSDKDSIYAFHFYRILQRAKNIFVLYNTESDNFNSGEKSRFVVQLLYELQDKNPKITIVEKTLETPALPVTEEKNISINKTDEIIKQIDQIAEKGFSPTSLNKFRNCSLQFYFSAIEGLREENEVEETIEADTLGKVIHSVLENIFKSFTGKTISSDKLKNYLPQIEKHVIESFRNEHQHHNFTQGKNFLVLKVAVKFITNYLKKEIADIELLQKNNSYVTIIDLEKELTREAVINSKKIKFKGKADRIDQINGEVRIIDYKTGRAETNELNVKDFNKLLNDSTLDKSFQLLMYAWMYGKPTQSGIITFKDIRSGLKTVKIDGKDQINEAVLGNFGRVIDSIVSDIYNKYKPFEKTNDIKVCEYCSYKTICSR